jgi:hypothetical protein
MADPVAKLSSQARKGWSPRPGARTIRMLTQADDVGLASPPCTSMLAPKRSSDTSTIGEANHILAGSGEVADLTTGEFTRASAKCASLEEIQQLNGILQYITLPWFSLF